MGEEFLAFLSHAGSQYYKKNRVRIADGVPYTVEISNAC